MDRAEHNEEIQQALDSEYPALALCRLSGFKICSPEKELSEHLKGDVFAYVCDLEAALKDLRSARRAA